MHWTRKVDLMYLKQVDDIGSKIRFNIVIPFGGNAKFLFQTIHSVLNQTHQQWTLRIIDDGTFEFEEVAKFVSETGDERVVLYGLPEKVGIIQIFAISLDSLDSDWGMILGADDLLDVLYLEQMQKFILEHSNIFHIQPNVRIMNERSKIQKPIADLVKSTVRPTKKTGVIAQKSLMNSIAIGNWMYVFGGIFNVEIFKSAGLSPDYLIVMDWDLILRTCASGAKFGYNPDAIFNYRRHSASVSNSNSNLRARLSEELKMGRNLAPLLRKNNFVLASILLRLNIFSRFNYIFKQLEFKNDRK
jgi:glycosyltransferase involved in cell wall biosynthesis